MGSSIIGGIVGGITSIVSAFQSNKSAKQQTKLAEEQTQLQKQTYQQQEQELNKANQREADVEALLDSNTLMDSGTTLTGAGSAGATPNANQLQKNSVLGE